LGGPSGQFRDGPRLLPLRLPYFATIVGQLMGQVPVGQLWNVGQASVNFGVQWCVHAQQVPEMLASPPTTVLSCDSVKARRVSLRSDNLRDERPNTKHLLADWQPKKEGTEHRPDFYDVPIARTADALADGPRLNGDRLRGFDAELRHCLFIAFV
jgi:hypothetical protein